MSERKRSQARGDARRAALLNAAARLAANADLAALTFKDIAAEAGVPQSSCYHFFSSRDELLRALWEREISQFRDIVFAPLDHPSSWMDVIETIVLRAQGFYAVNPTALRLVPLSNIPTPIVAARDERSLGNARTLLALLERYFELPALAQRLETLDWAMKIGEMVFTWSYLRHGRIADADRDEGVRAMVGYLKTYLPAELGPKRASDRPS